MISRRSFLVGGIGAVAGLFLGKAPAGSKEGFPQFFLAQLRYRGEDWDPYPQFPEPIIEELELRTSIVADRQRRIVAASDRELFFCPFLYMAGRYGFDPWSPEEREALGRYLTFGGFLLAEDTVGARGSGFDAAFRREMMQIFPRHGLQRLPLDHSVFQSFYLITTLGGRQKVNPYLEGVIIDNWTPVIYCQNDLAGAWARDKSGRWLQECTPGGEAQRSSAFRLGVNIIVYSLTGDYKKDLVHHPFIKKRLGS
jgi:hypothetical protein